MAFVEDVKKYVDIGITVSKDAFSKAGTAASRFGDQGVKRVELLQLSNKIKEQYSQLGEAVYNALYNNSGATLSAASDIVAPYLETITSLKASISERESALKAAQEKNAEKE